MDGISQDGHRNYLSVYLSRSSAFSGVTMDVGHKAASHPALALLNLEHDQIHHTATWRKIARAYVQNAYRKPVKQKTAMTIKKAN